MEKILNNKVRYDGHVNEILNDINEEKQIIILNWIAKCYVGIEIPEPCKKDRNLMAFIFKSNDNSIKGNFNKREISLLY